MFLFNLKEGKQLLELNFQLVNASSHKINLYKVASVLKKQIEEVYTIVENNFYCETIINVHYKLDLSHLYKKPTIVICNSITNNNVAESHFTGLLMKLNIQHLDSIINHKNKRTVAHEVGHLLGLDHPHANAKFESINTQAHILEQLLSEEEKKYNLMCQTWYIQKHRVDLNLATKLTQQQLQLIKENIQQNKLLNNYFIVKKWWGYKLVGNL